MDLNQVHTVPKDEPYAVFFSEAGDEAIVPLSKLPKDEEQKGGYLLVTPGVGSNWVPHAENMKDRVFEVGSLNSKFPPYESSPPHSYVGQPYLVIFPKK